MILYIFLVLSALTIFLGLMTILSRNPMHSVLYLILCFFTISCHYLLLNAAFLAIVNLIVYAGAIMVLFLSTIMLMNLNGETERHKPFVARMAAVVAAGLLMFVLVGALSKVNTIQVAYGPNSNMSSIENLGKVLMNEYLFPFEFTSVLFLSAMIGAVLLSKRERQAIS